MSKVIRGLRAFSALLNLSKWPSFYYTWEKTRFDRHFKVTFSQDGEDLALLFLVSQSPGRYLDIGAHHPDRFSNTRMLYDRGWRGVNVEANPKLIKEFLKKRPEDLTLNVCVGTKHKYTFTIFDEPAISTVNLDWKKKFLELKYTVDSEIEIEGISLYELITEHFASGDLTLLLIDAEGSDFDILMSGDFRRLPLALHPEWILVETSLPVLSALQESSIKYLVENQYEPILVLPRATVLRKKRVTSI